MRVGLLTQYYKPEMGAPQNRLYEMMRGLKNLGNEVCVVTAMPNYPTGKIFDKYRGKLTVKETVDDIEVKRYWLYASNSKRVLPRIWNMISFTVMSLFSIPYLRKQKLDYLIVETPPLTLAMCGRLVAALAGAKFVANVSDIWPLSAKELGAMSDGFLYKILEKIERRIYKKAYISMGQSEEIVQHIQNNGGKNVYLFRNGVDPNRFVVRTRLINKTASLKLIYAGLLGYAQGIFDICKSVNFRELGVEFHIYGAGGEQRDIEAFLSQNPDCGITYHGVVSRDELPPILISADMTLIPLVKHIYGAVPSKIYESMAAGLPILFVGEGEGATIVKENNIGLVTSSKNYDGLKENIRYAVAHREALETMSANCIKCAHDKFNRPKQIVALNEFLKSKI